VGDAARACDYARRWVALDPLDEAAHRRLMRALAESGQRTAALVQFERCRRLLDEEFGIALEPATVALYEELKQHIVRAAPASVLDDLAALLDASLIGESANSAGEPRSWSRMASCRAPRSCRRGMLRCWPTRPRTA
jgi:DNA-binding SARP family transcriptional activator